MCNLRERCELFGGAGGTAGEGSHQATSALGAMREAAEALRDSRKRLAR